jgi:NTE family protein
MLRQLVRGRSNVQPSARIVSFLRAHLPSGVHNFGDYQAVRPYIVATQLKTGTAHIWGDDPSESVLDAVMSSSALPPFFPPWPCGAEMCIDGAAVADLPLDVALHKGATEIYALHLATPTHYRTPWRVIQHTISHAVETIFERRVQCALPEPLATHVPLRYLPLTALPDVPFWDFSHTDELIAAGRHMTEAFLAQPHQSDTAHWATMSQLHRHNGLFMRARLLDALRPKHKPSEL